MEIVERDVCLLTLCPAQKSPTRENMVKVKCRDTQEVLTTSSSEETVATGSYQTAIKLSLYNDLVIYKGEIYRIAHMLTISYNLYVEEYQYRYENSYTPFKEATPA